MINNIFLMPALIFSFSAFLMQNTHAADTVSDSSLLSEHMFKLIRFKKITDNYAQYGYTKKEIDNSCSKEIKKVGFVKEIGSWQIELLPGSMEISRGEKLRCEWAQNPNFNPLINLRFFHGINNLNEVNNAPFFRLSGSIDVIEQTNMDLQIKSDKISIRDIYYVLELLAKNYQMPLKVIDEVDTVLDIAFEKEHQDFKNIIDEDVYRGTMLLSDFMKDKGFKLLSILPRNLKEKTMAELISAIFVSGNGHDNHGLMMILFTLIRTESSHYPDAANDILQHLLSFENDEKIEKALEIFWDRYKKNAVVSAKYLNKLIFSITGIDPKFSQSNPIVAIIQLKSHLDSVQQNSAEWILTSNGVYEMLLNTVRELRSINKKKYHDWKKSNEKQ